MENLKINKEMLQQTAFLICSMQITDKNPKNLRIIADLIEFWSNHIPKKEKPVKSKSVERREEIQKESK